MTQASERRRRSLAASRCQWKTQPEVGEARSLGQQMQATPVPVLVPAAFEFEGQKVHSKRSLQAIGGDPPRHGRLFITDARQTDARFEGASSPPLTADKQASPNPSASASSQLLPSRPLARGQDGRSA